MLVLFSNSNCFTILFYLVGINLANGEHKWNNMNSKKLHMI